MSKLARQIAEAYLRKIDGDDFGHPEDGHDLSDCAATVDMVLGQRTVVKTEWQVEINQPDGQTYEVGSTHDSLDSAKYYRDMCLKPKLGKRGWSRKTTFSIYRHERVKILEHEQNGRRA